MPKEEFVYKVRADRRGGVYITSDLRQAEQFAGERGEAVKIHVPFLSAVAAATT